MGNDNGRGIFYGVIGVATLVVAIIGATFAYFTASAANNDAINVGTTSVSLQLVENPGNTNFYTTMVPVTSTGVNFKYYPGFTAKDATHTGHGTCTDDNGNAICGVYVFGIKNPANVAQTVYGSLKVMETSFTVPQSKTKTNMHYAVYKGDMSAVDAPDFTDVDATNVSTNVAKHVDAAANGGLIVSKQPLGVTGDTHDKSTVGEWANTTQVLAPGATQFYTVLVWLEEAEALNADDQNKTIKLGITFNTSGGGTGVTGVIDTSKGAA